MTNEGHFEDFCKRNFLGISIFFLTILGFFVYGNSINGKFLWDDIFLVRDNPFIKHLAYFPKIFTVDIGAPTGQPYGFYRPLQILTYAFNYFLGGLDVRGYHIINIILHILVALSIFWLINLLSKDRLVSFLTGLFFLVHPIHTEAIAYISGRAEPLVVLLLLVAFIFYVKRSESGSSPAGIFCQLSFIFALLSKESALILPPLLGLYHYCFRKKVDREFFSTLVIIAILYIVFRFTFLKSFSLPPDEQTSFAQRIPGFFVAITQYLRLIIFPAGLHMEYGSQIFRWSEPQALLGVFFFFILPGYAISKRRDDRLLFFSVFWFFLTLLPVSNLYPLNAFMAEHWLYLPSAGFFLILSRGIAGLYRTKNLKIYAGLICISLLIFYSDLTIRQNHYWRDSINFYERTLRYSPQSWKLYYNLANKYMDTGRKSEAISFYEKVTKIKPRSAMAYHNLCVAYNVAGRKKDAVWACSTAIALDPHRAATYNNLATLYADLGDQKKAMELYEKAITINPDYALATNNFGSLCLRLRFVDEAIIFFKKASEINPDYAEAYAGLAMAATLKGRYEEAISSYRKALKIKPDYAEACANLSSLYFKIKNYHLAIEYYNKAKAMGFSDTVFEEALRPYRH